MKTDIILAGVGGQGVLSVAAVIAKAAVLAGFNARQSEVHGMAQRGGSVLAHLRLSDTVIHSDLIPKGSADMIISLEPLEALRYADFLSKNAAMISADEPFLNITNYPDINLIKNTIEKFPNHRLVAAQSIAKKIGLVKSVNIVMVGAASSFLPIPLDCFTKTIESMFAAREPALNLEAFEAGRKAQ
ncbi:MAG: indolepyruvate oxidoreductase subunit beta [Termitinemataceae bacterium]|nr:MAG: indolepyruvate oxidoreductase subunit beta [Termitinemataceae bacterium]